MEYEIPSAKVVKAHHLTVEIGQYAVKIQTSDQWKRDRYPWRVLGPWYQDGPERFRDTIEEFASYREAIAYAKKLDQGVTTWQ